ncbi:hypothetical protein N9B73_03390 [Verrucomicrobiales bacterium]|jgi:hypothetical protein|nr:hypothetical protein [Verrucomicrobiales bacterium]
MRLFLICLSPAIFGFVVILMNLGGNAMPNALMEGVIVLFGIGALLSGGCVARKIVLGSSDRTWLTWLGAVLSFIGVAAAYFAMTMGGCCGLVMATNSY